MGATAERGGDASQSSAGGEKVGVPYWGNCMGKNVLPRSLRKGGIAARGQVGRGG